MLKTRIILVVVCALLAVLLFQLPKSVVDNEREVGPDSVQSSDVAPATEPHAQMPKALRIKIGQFRTLHGTSSENEKKAIFADSLAGLYAKNGVFDSAAWFAEDASTFFNTIESWKKAGDHYYQAFTFALDQKKQNALASKAQEFYNKVLAKNANDFESKNNLAMTYISSNNPMQGVLMLREVLAKDPDNETALFNLGMLSVQSGQYENAIERLLRLVELNPNHIQGQLLLGVAYMQTGEKAKARNQFEKIRTMDKDPSVQATVDSYLKDLTQVTQ
jgi:tetratricopeptide (TPR) repeat protein